MTAHRLLKTPLFIKSMFLDENVVVPPVDTRIPAEGLHKD